MNIVNFIGGHPIDFFMSGKNGHPTIEEVWPVSSIQRVNILLQKKQNRIILLNVYGYFYVGFV